MAEMESLTDGVGGALTAGAGRKPSRNGGANPAPVALTIAGFDPSCGAGIGADLKTFAAHDVYGVAAITALTVQSTQGVRGIEHVSPKLLDETLRCLAEDVTLAGVKIGMLGHAGLVSQVAHFLDALATPRERVVLDPVVRSSSGAELLDREGVALLRRELLPRVGWITPNLQEAALLAGMQTPDWTAAPDAVETLDRGGVPEAARRLRALAAERGHPDLCVVITGGHLERPDDYLEAGDEAIWLPGERIETRATHGTGCAFSSALLCELIAGVSPAAAVTNAKAYVAVALRAAYPVGVGNGPMHHLFRLG